jgi:hypothetical protein
MRLPHMLTACAILLLAAAASTAQVITPPKLDVPMTAHNKSAVLIPAGSTEGVMTVLADPQSGGGDLFAVNTFDPNAAVTLILPDQTEITAANAEAQGFRFQVIPDGTFTTGNIPSPFSSPGTHTVIKLPPSSPAGNYRVRVNTPAASTDAVAIVTYFSSSTVRSGLTASASQYRVGETVVLSGLLLDGSSPITGATVTAVVGDPEDPQAEPAQVTLQDSGTYDAAPGDGVYTGTFTAARAGEFDIAMHASGASAAGVSFFRTASTGISVTAPLARFASFQTAGVSSDPATQVNPIVVTASINVQRAGNYQLGLTLKDGSGKRVTATSSAAFQLGAQQMSVSFSAKEIALLSTSAPLALKDAILVFRDDADNPVADFRETTEGTGPGDPPPPPPPDTTAPVTTVTLSQAANAAGWHNSNVVVTLSTTDNLNGSGVHDITYSATGAQTIGSTTSVGSSASVTVSAEGTTSVTFAAKDNAGNVEAAQTVTVKIDKTAPAVTINSPANTSYVLGQFVAASYACTDARSGVASCVGSAPNGSAVDTSSLGAKTFNVTAVDAAGNTYTSSAGYTVVNNSLYTVHLLYDPDAANKAGSTVPVKLQIFDAAGRNVSSSALTVHALGVIKDSDYAPGPVQDAGNANPDDDFRFNNFNGAGGYIFNLKTTGLTTGTYRVIFRVGADTFTYGAPFQIK